MSLPVKRSNPLVSRLQGCGGGGGQRRGVILLITLVILVILATLGYTLTVQVATRRHRDQYMIDYSVAKHACASGLKYALTTMGSLQFQLVSRPNEPDFSDVFALSEPEYQKLLDQLALSLVADNNLVDEGSGKKPARKDVRKKAAKKNSAQKAAKVEDANDANDLDPNSEMDVSREGLEIRGPYGPVWPLVTEPIELEIGSAKVTIEIEDENAKYPLGWAMMTDEKVRAEAAVGWMTFCEWMGYQPGEIASLSADLAKIGKIKPFKTEFKAATEVVEAPASLRGKITQPTTTTRSTTLRRTTSRKPVTVDEQVQRQNKEFAKLFHSSLIDKDLLSRPSVESDNRKESAMKYLGVWATRHVNVNTAPRHVLEAALTFASVADAPKIAEEIILRRQEKPVVDVNELKQAVVPRYSSLIDDGKDFITATSTVFTIRVTAVSGVARATAVAAVTKEGDKVQQIAAICD